MKYKVDASDNFRTVSEYIRVNSKVDSNGCWIWLGCLNHGYARCRWRKKRIMVHRLSYMERYGIIDSSLSIDHLCNNRSCVNPEHLQNISLKENQKRSNDIIKARVIERGTCFNGHRSTSENLRKNGVCKICANERNREYRKRLSGKLND